MTKWFSVGLITRRNVPANWLWLSDWLAGWLELIEGDVSAGGKTGAGKREVTFLQNKG